MYYIKIKNTNEKLTSIEFIKNDFYFNFSSSLDYIKFKKFLDVKIVYQLIKHFKNFKIDIYSDGGNCYE